MKKQDEQIFKIMAVPCNKAFVVAEEKTEAFLNHEVDSVIRENNQRTLDKVTPIIDAQIELGPVKKLGKKKK